MLDLHHLSTQRPRERSAEIGSQGAGLETGEEGGEEVGGRGQGRGEEGVGWRGGGGEEGGEGEDVLTAGGDFEEGPVECGERGEGARQGC